MDQLYMQRSMGPFLESQYSIKNSSTLREHLIHALLQKHVR